MRSFVFSVVLIFVFINAKAQVPKSGTYTYDYCDIEYNKCMGKCKVKIRGNKIWVYAPANLSGIKEGELYEAGTLYKHKAGKWTIINLKVNKSAKSYEAGGFNLWIDFKKKQFWAF